MVDPSLFTGPLVYQSIKQSGVPTLNGRINVMTSEPCIPSGQQGEQTYQKDRTQPGGSHRDLVIQRQLPPSFT